MIRLILLLFLSLDVFAQAFYEDFSAPDISSNNPWQGDIESVIIREEALHSNHQGAGNLYLSTPFLLVDTATWEVNVKLDFNPSSSNFARFYLMSSHSVLTGDLDGYYIQIGSSDDDIRLYRQSGAATTLLASGREDALNTSSVDIAIKVSRSVTADWKIDVDYDLDGIFDTEIDVNDATYNESQFFGLYAQFTSTRADKFSFDNVHAAPEFLDMTPPEVESFDFISENELAIVFSESISNVDLQLNDLLPISVSVEDNIARAVFGSPFENLLTYRLDVQNVEDLFQNISTPMSIERPFYAFSNGQFGAILINEIYPDQSPSVGLPPFDFVELYNNTDSAINLSGWTFSDLVTDVILPDRVILPGDYLIMHDDGLGIDFSPYGSTLTVDLPTLNVSGDHLSIRNRGGDLIHSISYTTTDYRDPDRDDGGYSLELINPDNFCSADNNLVASSSTIGGTPGAENSTLDYTFFEQIDITRATPLTSNSVLLQFNTPIVDALLLPDSYSISPSIQIDSISMEDDNVIITFTDPLEGLQEYTVDLLISSDCGFDVLSQSDYVYYDYGIPEIGDIVINEILYDPFIGESEFLEIVNVSDKYFNSEDFSIAIMRGDTISNSNRFPSSFIIPPETYSLLSENIESIRLVYEVPDTANIIEFPTIPSFVNSGAQVALIYEDSLIVDQVSYSDDLHYPLLDNSKGVSLEKVEPSLRGDNINNWHSASTVVLATPGFENSQFNSSLARLNNQDVLELESSVFFPNGDGYKDYLQINYTTNDNGYTANLYIYDLEGRLVLHLVKGEILGVDGFLRWDGIDDSGRKSKTGVYVLYAELFNTAGDIVKSRIPFTIGSK